MRAAAPPAPGATRFVEGVDAAVGNADAVGIAGEIGDDVVGAGEGAFGIADPVLIGEAAVAHGESGWLGAQLFRPMKLQFALLIESVESMAELAPKNRGERSNREEPVRLGPGSAAVFAQSPAGDDAMQMVVLLERMTPGM